jgi:magnesium-transporting ATPase (P-type)
MLIVRFTEILVLFVLLINLLFHRPWLESFLFAVVLAVGPTPELLPMIVSVTTTLAFAGLIEREFGGFSPPPNL